MRLLGLAGLVGACLATSPLLAADLFSSPPVEAAPAGGEVELGSNWYIRGDVSYGTTSQQTISADAGLFPTVGNQPIGNPTDSLSPSRGNNRTITTPELSVGFGYRVNDWLRMEATLGLSQGPGLTQKKDVTCPEVATPVNNYTYANAADTAGTEVPSGYAYDYTTCTGTLSMTQRNVTGLAMAYIDLGHWSLFTPYIGAGAGMNVNSVSGSLHYSQDNDGSTYAGTKAPTGSNLPYWVQQTGVDQAGRPIWGPLQPANPNLDTTQGIGPASWERKIAATKYTFAAAAAAGLGIQISQSATLDIGYKFMTLDITQGAKNMRQAVNVGVRYNLN